MARKCVEMGFYVSFAGPLTYPKNEALRTIAQTLPIDVMLVETDSPYLSPEKVLSTANAGKATGCKEILFTLGDKPELRYRAARDGLAELGFETTIEYVEHLAKLVFSETGLLPHINAGVMTKGEMERLKRVSVSQGLMLESLSARLCQRGGPHFGSPDKAPALRLQNIRFAGELQIPTEAGRGFRFEAGHRSDLMSATIPRIIRPPSPGFGHVPAGQ